MLFESSLDSATYYRLLRKIERGTVLEEFEEFLSQIGPVPTEVRHNKEGQRLFVELQIISIKEQKPLTIADLHEFVESWSSLFPLLTVRLSGSNHITKGELGVIKFLLNVNPDSLSRFLRKLKSEIDVSYYRRTEVINEPETTDAMTSAQRESFSELVVDIDDPMIKE